MQVRFNVDAYHQRSQVETVVSIDQAPIGKSCAGTLNTTATPGTPLDGADNVMIFRRIEVFYRAGQNYLLVGRGG